MGRLRRSSRASGRRNDPPGLPDRLAERLDELRAEIAEFERLATVAEEGREMGSAVAARGRAADLRREAHRVAVECRNAGIVDEIARLAASRSAAATDGSWTAAAAMTRQLEEARTRQKAEAAEEEERRRRNATVTEEQLIESLIRLPRATLARIVERLAGTAA